MTASLKAKALSDVFFFFFYNTNQGDFQVWEEEEDEEYCGSVQSGNF